MNAVDFKYMKEGMVADLAAILVNDYGMSPVQALDVLYNSETYAKLSNPATGLYYQSSLYVFSILQDELRLENVCKLSIQPLLYVSKNHPCHPKKHLI